MPGLEMKYFVLKPRAKAYVDAYASASQRAMEAYADAIKAFDAELASEMQEWADQEAARQAALSPERCR